MVDMPYFPKSDLSYEYKCEGCGNWYKVTYPTVSCTVLHPPGTCCHYMEELVKRGKKDA